MRLTLLLTILSILVSALSAQPLPPSQDAWYDQPGNISSYSPGQLIRFRQISPQLQSFFSIPITVSTKAAYQYLFRTTDSLGHAVAAAATLIEPYHSDPSKLLAYQTAYDSATQDCSPSYLLQSRFKGIGGFLMPLTNMSTDIPFIAASLNQGWWVLTTDYEGLEAQFTAGLQSGYATLDSVRVILQEAPKVGLSTNPRYALSGYSGGAIAVAWAAELQPTYAPELKFAGAALGSVTPNMSSTLETINRGFFAGLGFAGIYGQAKAYPNFTTWLQQNLLPEKAARFLDLASGCIFAVEQKGKFQDLYSYFKNGKSSLEEPIPQSIFQWSAQMGVHGTPTVPLYVYMAVGDEIDPIADTDALVNKYCAQGTSIEYHRNLVGEHVLNDIIGSANALKWVSERLNGKAVESQCITKQVVLIELDPVTILVLGEEIFAFLQSVVGGRVG